MTEVKVKITLLALNKILMMELQPSFVLEELTVSFSKILDRSFESYDIAFFIGTKELNKHKSLDEQDFPIDPSAQLDIKVILKPLNP